MWIKELYLRTYMQAHNASNSSEKRAYLFEGEGDMGRKKEKDWRNDIKL